MTDYLHYSDAQHSLDDIGNSACHGAMDDNTKAQLYTANPHIQQPTGPNYHCSPILLPGSVTSRSQPFQLPQCTPQEYQRLNSLSAYAGGAATMALAELIDELKVPSFASDLNTFGGNGIGAAAQASSFMIGDIAHYDALLKEYHDLKNHRAAPATLMQQEAKLKRAFKKMNASLNQRGQHILHKHAGKTKEVLNARGKVGYQSIPVGSQVDVQRLAKLAKFGKVAGPGFMLLDGFFRYDKVATMRQQNNEKWKREAVIQSASFTAGILVGTGIMFLVAISPVGIVAGIVAAGVMAIIADRAATGFINKGYDLLAN